MDRVRFGRALGYGARHATKSLLQAAAAASAPNPAGTVPAADRQAAQGPAQAPRVPVAERVAQVREGVVQTKAHAGRLGKSVLGPVAQYSSVLWLQVTGTFFALIALFLSQGVWKQHAAWRMWGSHEATKFYVVAVACALFAYLAVSNFVRAARRERKH